MVFYKINSATKIKCESLALLKKIKYTLLLMPSEKMINSKIKKTPHLQWGKYDTGGISSSGFNTFSPFRKTRVSLTDEAKYKNRISLIIEPSCPGKSVLAAYFILVPIWPVLLHTIVQCTFADGYIFEKNTETGNIDMRHRTKPFYGEETIEIFRNCTNLKLTNKIGKNPIAQSQEELVLLLTSQFNEQQFPIGIYSDSPFGAGLPIAIEAINTFIETVGRDRTLGCNNSATVHNLFCTIQEYDRQCTREYESLLLAPHSDLDNTDFDEHTDNNSTLYTSENENGISTRNLSNIEAEENVSCYADACIVPGIPCIEEFPECKSENLPMALCVSNPILYVQSSYS
jgi:hypothetical protein